MQVSSAFDGGSIELVEVQDNTVLLNLRSDTRADFKQWFYFQVNAEGAAELEFYIRNACAASYPEGWKGYRPFLSYDRRHWQRVEAAYDGQSLSFKVQPAYDCFYIAYYVPYSFERHLDLLSWAQVAPHCQRERLCSTVAGRDLELLKVGSGNTVCWMIARQHPGETMAEWFMEGFLEHLLDPHHAVAKRLLEQVCFYIVPNMNPDGAAAGNLRTNAAGANLNREWLEPTLANSPEVYYVRERMQQTGVDMFLDIHGDEAIPYNFVAGHEGTPNYTETIAAQSRRFKSLLLAVSEEFQTRYGYEVDEPGQSDLLKACDYVGNTYRCVAFTLEMPFKDHNYCTDARYGWSPRRCKGLAHDVLITLSKYHQGQK